MVKPWVVRLYVEIIHSLKLVDYLHVQADNPWYNYYISLFFQVCTNGLLSFEIPYTSYIVPPAGIDLQETDLEGRRVLFPYFTDITTFNEGRVYYRVKDIIGDDTLSSDSDVIAINEAVRSSQGLAEYSSDMIVEVTWENVGMFGGSSSQVSV